MYVRWWAAAQGWARAENCTVWISPGIVRRHGPIDLVRPKRPGEGGGGDGTHQGLPMCDQIVSAFVPEMSDCGLRIPAVR